SRVAPLAAWVWTHRDALLRMPIDIANFVEQLIENGADAVRRVGSTITFGSADGTSHVLGFVDQTFTSLDDVESGATPGESDKSLVATSLASLQALSMVPFGLATLNPRALFAQFGYLHRQPDCLTKSIDDLRAILEHGAAAKLKSGLDVLD